MKTVKIYQVFAHAVRRYKSLQAVLEYEEDPFKQKVIRERLERVEMLINRLEEHLPSGSGFNDPATLDLDASNSHKLVFNVSFHHMNEHGFYDKWTHHSVVVSPSFDGFLLKVTGKNHNQIKEYIHDIFSGILDLDSEIQLPLNLNT